MKMLELAGDHVQFVKHASNKYKLGKMEDILEQEHRYEKLCQKYFKHLGFKWYALLTAIVFFILVAKGVVDGIIFLFDKKNTIASFERAYEKSIGYQFDDKINI